MRLQLTGIYKLENHTNEIIDPILELDDVFDRPTEKRCLIKGALIGNDNITYITDGVWYEYESTYEDPEILDVIHKYVLERKISEKKSSKTSVTDGYKQPQKTVVINTSLPTKKEEKCLFSRICRFFKKVFCK